MPVTTMGEGAPVGTAGGRIRYRRWGGFRNDGVGEA
jgi:hypothetical protein